MSDASPTMQDRAAALLETWARAAEGYWHVAEDNPSLGCYGPGYLTWGVQTNWNYAAAVATLARHAPAAQQARWRDRAVSALRFALATHVTGGRPGNDGKLWGNSWISMLGIERAMHGLGPLVATLPEADQAALRRVLISEADWILLRAGRGKAEGVVAGLWNGDGRNNPESNIWWGCLLWRVAELYPHEDHAAAWKERASQCLVNGVSVERDAQDGTVVDGRPVSARHVGANFFPHYALDHHGYLNVGYMVICASNAALLHFDLKQSGLRPPESLYHHQNDLWQVIRRMIFGDGRLARIGGDSRVRYAYCQEYLLPALLFAADALQDGHALPLVARMLKLMERDAAGGDGTFYGRRLASLARENPHYFTRLEADRASVLAMLLNYLPLVQAPPEPAASFEESVAGGWEEDAHGAVLHRSPHRLCSFAWRAHGLTQGTCQPPSEGNLAEWSLNLSPVVRFIGDDGTPGKHRRLIDHQITPFDGGFVTCGRVMEGVDVPVPEGASCTNQAVTQIAFAALPDGRTCLGLHYVVAASDRVGYLSELKDLHLNVPNDLFNGSRRTIRTATGTTVLTSPPERNEVRDFKGPWLSIDEHIGILLLYGGDRFRIDRSTQRRGGRYQSLFVEEVCLQVRTRVTRCRPGDILSDAGFAILSGVGADVTARVQSDVMTFKQGGLRGVWVVGADGNRYTLVANFGQTDAQVDVFGEAIAVAAGKAVLRQTACHG